MNSSSGQSLPLEGIRVLEVANVIAAPYAGSLLRLLGAEVVKLESPGGDPIRNWNSPRGPLPFAQINAGKQSIVVDLKAPEGRALLDQLIPTFDVFTHNYRPATVEKLGLSGETLLGLNPRLVYLSVSGYGRTGPLAGRPAYDSIGQAFSGLLSLLTPSDRMPEVGPALGDLGTGIVAAAGVMAGLVQRERTGRGTVVETSLLEGTISLISDQFSHLQATGTQFNVEARSRTSAIFPCHTADGDIIIVHLSTSQKFFEALMVALGCSHLVDDERYSTFDGRVRNHDELLTEIESFSRQWPTTKLIDVLLKADVPHTRVNSLADVMADPHIEALGMFADTDDASGMSFTGAPWSFDGRRPGGVHDWPTKGRDTNAVLGEFLTTDQIDRLRELGVIGDGRE